MADRKEKKYGPAAGVYDEAAIAAMKDMKDEKPSPQWWDDPMYNRDLEAMVADLREKVRLYAVEHPDEKLPPLLAQYLEGENEDGAKDD